MPYIDVLVANEEDAEKVLEEDGEGVGPFPHGISLYGPGFHANGGGAV